MLIQRVTVRGEAKQLVAFFYSGSNIHLVRKRFAEEAGWRGMAVQQPIMTAGGEAKVWDSMEYWIPLIRNDGSEISVLALAMDQITEELVGVDVTKAAQMFGCCPSRIN